MKKTPDILEQWAHGRAYPLLAVFLLVWVAYVPALDNELTNWDDDKYITDNVLIQEISLQSLAVAFGTQTQVVGNYHPLTVLSYSLNYKLSGDSAWALIFTNVLLHSLLAIVLLVFLRRLTADHLLAFLATLLFALHPMRVESVAWISERKDVLYLLFYLLALLQYLRYADIGHKAFYVQALLLFMLSVLSKGQAVTLPAVLLLTDYLRGRSFTSGRIWLEKLPFFFIAGLGAYLAFSSQGSVGYVSSDFPFSFGQQLFFASAGFSLYLLKGFIPFELSAFYAYPYEAQLSREVPAAFYWYSIPVILYIILCILIFVKSIKKAAGHRLRLLFFALMVFPVGLLPVLQLFPVGIAYMADRYSFLPAVGLSLILAMGLLWLMRKKGRWQSGLVIALLTVLYYGGYSMQRSNVWQDSLTLWRDVLSKNDKIATAWNNLGKAQKSHKGELEAALESYNRAIELDSGHYRAYTNRGNILAAFGRHKEAIGDFNRALQINPREAVLYYNRGLSYAITGNTAAARQDYARAMQLNPAYIKRQVPYDEGLLMLGTTAYDEGDIERAIRMMSLSIDMNPNQPRAWYNRGVAYDRAGQAKPAINDYSRAIALDPAYVQPYYNRGRLLLRMGMREEACPDLQKAAQAGYRDAQEVFLQNCQ